jgi:sentrin-specific protease 1
VELVNSVSQPPPPSPDVAKKVESAPVKVVAVEEDGDDRKEHGDEVEEVVRGSVAIRRVPLYKELYEASSRKRDARLRTLQFEVRLAEEGRLCLERLAEVLPRITPKEVRSAWIFVFFLFFDEPEQIVQQGVSLA